MQGIQFRIDIRARLAAVEIVVNLAITENHGTHITVCAPVRQYCGSGRMSRKCQTCSENGNLNRYMADFDGIDAPAISFQIGGSFVCTCNRADEEVTNLVALEGRHPDFGIDLGICFPD